ncbi:MAG: hypothetical protein AMXMBFR66_15400 [Pseudomonadota bacterium]|nr:DUF1501 domain-containing protein [Rubrivivax sp.]NLZ43178.1 DUF1501 domain-containing protein [Comamonadaceae bacterium]
MQRRHLLHAVAALPLAGGAARLFAAPAAGSRLLLVFLRGAYDCCSLLVPTSSSFYYEVRPDIAVPRTGEQAALPLDADWGLHPVLRETLHPMFRRGELAFVAFAGTEDSSRSHFETQDSIELGQALGAARDYHSGFLNRLAGVCRGAAPMAFTAQLPLSMQGRVPVANMALDRVASAAVDPRQSRLVASMYRGSALATRVDEGFELRDRVGRELRSEMQAASRNAISARGFGAQARRIARLMAEHYDIGFVDVGGWDTHVGQGAAAGYLASRLDDLARGLVAYAEELGPAWRDTTVVVISEFGRTFRQNGNRGTDHGHGTVYWVLGGSVRGGRIAGEQVRVERATLFQDRDLPVLNEYRAVLAGLFRRQFGLGGAQLDQVFGGVAPRDLQLL